MNSIAIALGPERTRTELLPYITELLDDDAEVLAELATVLGAMLDYIGGYHFCEHIFGPLEKLCLIEESLVRDRAAESIIKILGRLKQQNFEYFEPCVMAMVGRLICGDGISAKYAAIQLIPTVYQCVSAPR